MHQHQHQHQQQQHHHHRHWHRHGHGRAPPRRFHTTVCAATAAHYTATDNDAQFRVFNPPVISISNLLAGERATAQQIQQVQSECADTGFLAITGHGIPTSQLRQLFEAAGRLFDLPLSAKLQLVVQDMQAGRGYEISPEHKAYMKDFQQQLQAAADGGSNAGLLQPAAAPAAAVGAPEQAQDQEPSALAGILAERFCCGPELAPEQLADDYYTSQLGRVFFPPNAWPHQAAAPCRAPELRAEMLACYSRCEGIAAALMRLFAASLGLREGFFAPALAHHHSNMQVANYPSQLLPPGPENLRKRAHVDSGTLTILACDDWLPGSTWVGGQGGLQLLSAQQEWLEVQVPPGALLVNLGSLMTRWTNTLWKSTLHRVTNPPAGRRARSRRLSMAFFHKPAYDAVLEVLPTCYTRGEATVAAGSSSSSSGDGGSIASLERVAGLGRLPDAPLFEAALVGDLTRQGILHKYRHLPPEQASAKYHEHLASIRSTAG